MRCMLVHACSIVNGGSCATHRRRHDRAARDVRKLGDEGPSARKEVHEDLVPAPGLGLGLWPSVYDMGRSQGTMANISRSTHASVRSSAFLHMSHESMIQGAFMSHTHMRWSP